MTWQNLDCKQIHNIHRREAQLLLEQNKIDAHKTSLERNKLGQYATPNHLAHEIIDYCKSLIPYDQKICFLDPAIGTGSLYSALLKLFPVGQIDRAVGYEIDKNYADIALRLWADTPLKVNRADFTEVSSPEKENLRFNLLICNPPYIRHHYLSSEQKKKLKKRVIEELDINLSGLSGLYCYFLLLAHRWMSQDGLSCWLIPSEFMDVNYGDKIKNYLLNQVTLIRVHRFDPEQLQFDNVLVSTSVIWFENKKPDPQYSVEFTSGNSIKKPCLSRQLESSLLNKTRKWSRFFGSESRHKKDSVTIKLSDFFTIKRGVATGANHFFILAPERIEEIGIPPEFITPILPSPRHLKNDEIFANETGLPTLKKSLFLLNCKLKMKDLRLDYPAVWSYLNQGIDSGISERYLCRHRPLWYFQETRQPTHFLCTYMGRKHSQNRQPFRFILNHSQAIAPNVYLMMYPKPNLATRLEAHPELLKSVWEALKLIPMESLINGGRVYGDGLYKLEPRELANAPAHRLLEI